MYYFQDIEFLYILAAVPLMLLLFILLIRWKKRAVKKIGDPRLVKELIKGYSPSLFTFKFFLVLTAFIACVLAVASFVSPQGSQKVKRTGIDLMIGLDVSNSMLADDIKPNRLERAKQIVSKVIDRLSDDRIGIVIFAGKAYLQMPMTTDHSAAKMYLSSASPDDVPTQGTVISQALKMCYSAFNTREKKYRAILLITDGEDHDEEAIKTTKELARNGVMVNTIGIGSPQGAPIRDKETNEYKRDENGATVITRLNEEELKSIAENGNGLYQLYTSADDVADRLANQLAGIGKTSLVDSSTAVYENYFWYFLLAALTLLVAEMLVPERKKIKTSRRYKLVTTSVMLLLFSNYSFGQNVKPEIISGNEAYKNKKYNEAGASYQKALSKAPENAIASYNLGNTNYRKDKPEDAANLYDNTIKNAPDNITREKAYYNKGVAYQKQNKLPECITAYKKALKIFPNDEEARQNLERALMQQKQKNQDDKKDQKNQNKDQNKKQEPKPQPSKISKQDAEEKLKTLLAHEKDLQEKLKKVRTAAPDKPKQDW
ncbi:MAG: VWA domain-containing protein [Ginsengibacter sp.]